jgi:inhibitor of cysteine peptidase
MPLAMQLTRYCLQLIIMIIIATPVPARALELTEFDCGRSVTLKSDETLAVVLPGNPTTGFLWEIARLDSEILKCEGETSFKGNSTLTGAGGIFTVRFFPLKPGRTLLTLVYRRPWEANVPPAASFEVVINVLAPDADD